MEEKAFFDILILCKLLIKNRNGVLSMERICEVSISADYCTVEATMNLIKQVYTACFGYAHIPLIEPQPEKGCTTKGVFLFSKITELGTVVPQSIYTPWGVIEPFASVERRVLTCEQIGALRVPNFESVYKNLKIISSTDDAKLFSLTENSTMLIFEPLDYSIYTEQWDTLLEVCNQ